MAKYTTQTFIEKVKQKHGEKYDYSLTEYTIAQDKIIIICPSHGRFEQQAVEHMRGRGCMKCSREKNYKNLFKMIDGELKVPTAGLRYTTDSYIIAARNVHGYKYDYSKLEFKGSNQPVTIICPNHGVFTPDASDHLRGYGCRACSTRYTREEFIEKSNEAHNNKYDYSEVEFNLTSEKVKIICPKHGAFFQTAVSHMKGMGCAKCNFILKEDFIEKSNIVHGGLYDYSKSNYINTKFNVNIICHKHGEFSVNAGMHMYGTGCPRCEGRNLTTSDFIELSAYKHGGRYVYTASTFTSRQDEIIVTCPIHGNYLQKAGLHLRGSGCHSCKKSKGELEIQNILKERKIEFIPEHTFSDCINPETGRLLRFDFYIPLYRLSIEFDGQQHYEPSSNWFDKDENSFLNRQKRDAIKNVYCSDNNIVMLRIPYFEIDRISEILSKRLMDLEIQKKSN